MDIFSEATGIPKRVCPQPEVVLSEMDYSAAFEPVLGCDRLSQGAGE